jgi:hypothetical protein
MAKISIPCLVGRTNKAKVTSWYWQPSKTLRDAGWDPRPLGKNEGAAIAAAQEINREVEEWKRGATVPQVRDRRQDGTLGHAIELYRRDVVKGTKPDGSPRIAPSTAKTYETGLKRLEHWAGKHPLAFITRARVRTLRTGMMSPEAAGGIGHHAAHSTLKIGRQLFAYLIDEDLWEQGKNPFEDFGLGQPGPRDVIWSPPARELIVATADRLGFPSIALAIVLGYAIGQREADILQTVIPQYVVLPAHKMQPEDYATLAAAAPDNIPRGIRIRQNKTGAWIEVPVTGDTRRRLEANIERARAAERLNMILDDTRTEADRVAIYAGTSGQTRFIRDFADVREAAAIAAEQQQQPDLAAEIRTLQFRDLRRTCVVYLGELGLEDHLIAAITGHDIDETRRILKTYMPRTTGRAARAIALVTAREAKDRERREQA